MDRGASAALKNQDLTDGIYEDAKTDAARFGAAKESSTTGSNAAFNAGAASGTDSVSGQSDATSTSQSAKSNSEFHDAVQKAADKVLGNQ